jgi:inner membrane protein
MTAATHYAFSYLVITAAGLGHGTALAASVLSLLPDIDHPESLAGRVFPPAAKYLQRKYGHRTITHSLFAVLVISVLLLPVIFFSPPSMGGDGGGWSNGLYAALLLAYASHIFIDLFNRSGVRLLAPVTAREYISFRTPELRILVSSWQEYVLLFCIVFLAFSVTGEAFSFTRAVRSVSKVFYRHYDGAVVDYQANSEYLCTAKIEYFDHVTTRKVTEHFIVLNMFPEKMYGLKIENLLSIRPVGDRHACPLPANPARVIIKKSDINEIEVTRTERRVNATPLTGTCLADLDKIPAGTFVSGTIVIKNYQPELRNTDYIRVDRTPSNTTITLTCAMPHELADVIHIEKDRNREIASLRAKTSLVQINLLQAEETSLKRRLAALQRKGLYENYPQIHRLTGELKKVESRVDSLKMREASGADVDLLMKIEKLEKEFGVDYKLYMIHNI